VILHSQSTCVGETEHLKCGNAKEFSTNIDWWYQERPKVVAVQLISAGFLVNGDREGRLRIDGSMLVIRNANAANDNGIYTCTEHGGQGMKHRINLTVLGKLSDQTSYATHSK